ncbi:MAG: hypothetical protein KatS3mg059_0220 [Thermomicrobiales bacterium]|nr:MAG: hypothetical protein KatS3mg059_0220 [Thermomicrobiales bacterium]
MSLVPDAVSGERELECEAFACEDDQCAYVWGTVAEKDGNDE